MSPPSLPTGTVSSDRRGEQTYPRSPEGIESPGRDEHVAESPPAASKRDSRTTGPTVPAARSSSSSAPGLQRRPDSPQPRTDDLRPQNDNRRRNDELRRRTDDLERRLAERDVELQKVIDHYESLLAKRTREQSSRESAEGNLCASVANALDRIADAVNRFRSTFVRR